MFMTFYATTTTSHDEHIVVLGSTCTTNPMIVNIRLAPPCGTSASQAWVAKSKTFFVVCFEVWARSKNAKESTMYCQTKTSW